MNWRSLEDVFEDTDRDANAGVITGIVDRTWVEERLKKRTSAEHYAAAPSGLTRNARIVWYRQHGWDLQEIAEEFGISRQRVHAICKREASRRNEGR